MHPDLHALISDERDRDTERPTKSMREAAPEPAPVGDEVAVLRERLADELRRAA